MDKLESLKRMAEQLQRKKPRKGIATRINELERRDQELRGCKEKSPVRGLQPTLAKNDKGTFYVIRLQRKKPRKGIATRGEGRLQLRDEYAVAKKKAP